MNWTEWVKNGDTGYKQLQIFGESVRWRPRIWRKERPYLSTEFDLPNPWQWCELKKKQFESIRNKFIYISRSFTPNIHHSFISIQPWRPGLAGTRVQSCDRYGSGTLHPGHVPGGSLPLHSPAFRRSHFSRQVPPSAMTREILATKGGTVGEKHVR